MAKKQKRTAMRKVREILRLHYESRLSNQQIADALRISKTSVFNILERYRESGMIWPVPEDLADAELEAPRLKGGASKKFIGLEGESPKPPKKGAIHPLARQGVFWRSFIKPRRK